MNEKIYYHVYCSTLFEDFKNVVSLTLLIINDNNKKTRNVDETFVCDEKTILTENLRNTNN